MNKKLELCDQPRIGAPIIFGVVSRPKLGVRQLPRDAVNAANAVNAPTARQSSPTSSPLPSTTQRLRRCIHPVRPSHQRSTSSSRPPVDPLHNRQNGFRVLVSAGGALLVQPTASFELASAAISSTQAVSCDMGGALSYQNRRKTANMPL